MLLRRFRVCVNDIVGISLFVCMLCNVVLLLFKLLMFMVLIVVSIVVRVFSVIINLILIDYCGKCMFVF